MEGRSSEVPAGRGTHILGEAVVGVDWWYSTGTNSMTADSANTACMYRSTFHLYRRGKQSQPASVTLYYYSYPFHTPRQLKVQYGRTPAAHAAGMRC